MVSASSPPSSMVDFPFPSAGEPGSSGTPQRSALQRPQYLPFRRISLPTAPSMIKRHSVASMVSFESMPEEGAPSAPGAMMPLVMKNAARKSKARPVALEPERRRSNWKLRPIDEAREAKRRKIVNEFFETERTYVDGLDLIYAHFLTPIIESLDSPQPLLERSELTSVFSNFIDIWNLHRSFFSSLSTLLHASTSSSPDSSAPPLSPVLLSHFPYLSLYNPFVTAFPDALASLNSLLATRPAFAAFIAKQEADERCAKLKVRDWLLTIVQRCPRYLLLLKDLIGCTDSEDAEHASLTAVHTLVSKITNTLNTSLHTHAQTLALLALQRSTAQLPFQLITPGRTFLRRGPLLQLDGPADPKAREFLLFSDCLVWLASADGRDGEPAEKWEWGHRQGVGGGYLAVRPAMVRKRSKSDAELPTLRSTSDLNESGGEAGTPARPKTGGFGPRVRGAVPKPAKKQQKKRVASSGQEEKWVFKGRAELVDLEVVVSPLREPGDERRLEVLSPEKSFAVYASSEEERDQWIATIRNAKASLLISLNAMHPNSTLTASASNAHLRRTLMALPHLPEDEASGKKPKRGKVEHFVPAIWIPDAKTESCMRCGRTFGWRRRRHHCRLCGRCVCSSCSDRTFYISDQGAKPSNKPARACEACYETVFPIISTDGTLPTPMPSAFMQPSNTTSTFSGFPSWQSISMPSLALPGAASKNASALLGSAFGSPSRRPSEASPGIESVDQSRTPPRIRIKAPSRPRSYVQILEDFHAQGVGTGAPPGTPNSAAGLGLWPELAAPGTPSRSTSQRSALSMDDRSSYDALPASDGDQFTTGALTDEGTPSGSGSPLSRSPPSAGFASYDGGSVVSSGSRLGSLPTTPKRHEDTVRRHKRFSMPAMALQTTPVTAKPNATGEGRAKRFSLVLGRSMDARKSGSIRSGSRDGSGQAPGTETAKGLSSGAAAVKLGEILGRKQTG